MIPSGYQQVTARIGILKPHRFTPNGRAFLAALLHRLPAQVLHRLRLLVRPDTVLRWHRDLVACRHAVAPPGLRKVTFGDRSPARSLAAGERIMTGMIGFPPGR
ncbi:MAG: hypothetical protein JWN52_4192 [Actinomycetia bacterium]|nr:hypothetical protein [Actinomycetes bacterium]